MRKQTAMRTFFIILLASLCFSSCIGDPYTIYQFRVTNSTSKNIVLDVSPQTNLAEDTMTISPGSTKVLGTVGQVAKKGANYYAERGDIMPGMRMWQDGQEVTKRIADAQYWPLTWVRDTGRYDLVVDSTFF